MPSKLARYRRRRRNPELSLSSVSGPAVDAAYSAAAGFAGYAATRVLGRLVYAQTQKRWPGLSKHLAIAASGLGVVGAHFVGQLWEPAAEYEDAIVVGAGVAALQAAVQTYLPSRYAALVSDWQGPDEGEAAAVVAASAAAPLALPAPSSPDAELERILAENSLELAPEPMGALGDFSDADLDVSEAA